MRTQFGETGEFAWMHKMDKIELMRSSVVVLGRSGQQWRPDPNKCTEKGHSSYRSEMVSEEGQVAIIQLIPSHSSCLSMQVVPPLQSG